MRVTRLWLYEDLISTGGSSLSAVEALREADCEVLGMLAIFTYGFQKSVDAFKEASCKLDTLCNYEVLSVEAVEKGYVSESELEALKKWRVDPAAWAK